jgi:hypothetical protein
MNTARASPQHNKAQVCVDMERAPIFELFGILFTRVVSSNTGFNHAEARFSFPNIRYWHCALITLTWKTHLTEQPFNDLSEDAQAFVNKENTVRLLINVTWQTHQKERNQWDLFGSCCWSSTLQILARTLNWGSIELSLKIPSNFHILLLVSKAPLCFFQVSSGSFMFFLKYCASKICGCCGRFPSSGKFDSSSLW